MPPSFAMRSNAARGAPSSGRRVALAALGPGPDEPRAGDRVVALGERESLARLATLAEPG